MKKHLIVVSKLPARAQDPVEDPVEKTLATAAEFLDVFSDIADDFVDMLAYKDPDVD